MSPTAAPKNDAAQRRWLKPATILVFLAYLFTIGRESLRAPFAADDILALHIYWHPSPWRLLTSQLMLWKGYFRPLNGFFYMPVFHLWGLDPRPYHVVLLCLLAVGAYQLYRVARSLGAPGLAAAMAALIACYHGGMANLYYNTVYVGDVLCGICYWAALANYAAIRRSGRLLSGRQIAGFLALYLCAINAKEIGVTMPAMLLAYEFLFHGRPGRRVREVVAWLRGPGRVICLAGLLNVLYIYGKMFGSEGLMKNPAYRPVYSWARFADFEKRYLTDIFYQTEKLGGWATCILWLIVTYLAWRRPRPILRFCWIFIVVSPLPIMFLEGRDQANLYVTLAGWAILAAALFDQWVINEVQMFRRPASMRVAFAAVAMMLAACGAWTYKETQIVPVIPQLSPLTAEVLAEFRATNPQAPPASRVVFLEDPWPGGYDMSMLAELWFRDRKTRVYLNQKMPQKPEFIDKADAVFTWKDGRLIRLR